MLKNRLLNSVSFEDRIMLRAEGEGGEGGGGGGAPSGPAPSPTSESTGQPAAGNDFDFGSSRGFGERFSTQAENKIVSDLADKPGDFVLDSDQLAAMLNFNIPFGEPKKEEPKPEAPKPEVPAKPEAKTEESKPAELSPDVKALVEALKAQQKPPEQPKPAEPAKPAERKPFYGSVKPELQIHPELAKAVYEADTPERSAQALNMIVSGVMNQVMEDAAAMMMGQMHQMQQYIQTQIPQMVQNTNQSSKNSEKFFDMHKELDKPVFRPLINSLAAAMVQAEYQKPGFNPGSPEFLGRLGMAVHAKIKEEFGFDLPRAAAPAVGNPPAAPARKPQFQTNGSARPPAAGPANGNQSADILSHLI